VATTRAFSTAKSRTTFDGGWLFETDDGRTLVGAAASFLDFVVVIVFLKPLSITLPFAARLTDGKTASRARQRP